MKTKISYFVDDKFNIYQTPSNIDNFFLNRKFKKINNAEIKDLKKNNKIFFRFKRRINIYFKLFKRVKFMYGLIKKKKIIIFDDITGELSFFFKKKDFFLINSRLININKLYFNINILKFIILNYFKRSIKLNYLIALISNIDPKIVVTFIDNSKEFHYLSKYFNKKIRFLAIQNATRGDYHYLTKKEKEKIFFQKLFCIGGYDIELFKNLKISGNFQNAGSLRTSIFVNKFNNELNQKKIFDICLIGKNLVKVVHADLNYEDSIIPEYLILLENIKRYVEEKKLSLVVCCKNYGFKLDAEKFFYEKFFGSLNVSISMNGKDLYDRNYFNSYKSILKSEIVVGLNSTLLRESFYFDKKTLCVDFSQKKKQPFKDISLCESKNFNDLKFKLDLLLKMNRDDYFKNLNYPEDYIVSKNDIFTEINNINQTLERQ